MLKIKKLFLSIYKYFKKPAIKVFKWFVIIWLFTALFEINIKPRQDVIWLFNKIETKNQAVQSASSESALKELVLPGDGVILPLAWSDLGRQLIDLGVIDRTKFEELYKTRGGLSSEDQILIYGQSMEKLEINSANAGLILNLLWAFGLANRNPILDNGPMVDKQYGGADRFASTGWTLASGKAMDHYSKHQLINLTPSQQQIVESMAKSIYRPCCGNSVYFPDCNHGMAMLGLLELMASQGASELEMYKAALQVNAYWFPDTYLTLAKYFTARGVGWSEVDAKTVLGSAYSSAAGFKEILKEVEPVRAGSGGGGCGA